MSRAPRQTSTGVCQIKLLSNTSEVVARVDDTAAVCLNGRAYLENLRSTSCALLVHSSKYSDTLRSAYNQWKKRNKSVSEHALSISHTNSHFLNSPEKNKKISECKARVKAAEKCFQRVIWEQQQEALKAKSPKHYRCHPMMIRWCLHLHMLSSATYRTMQSSGVITLPSQCTL